MAKFVNNEPKFKVGDKVVYSRRCDDPTCWEIESINAGTMVIKKVRTHYEDDKLVDVDYYTDKTVYVYSENWLSYAPVGPKFKIGDKVEFISGWYSNSIKDYYLVEDVLVVHYEKDGHEEYFYKITGWSFSISEDALKPKVISEAEQLIHDLEICGGEDSCDGCSRNNPDGSGTGCDKLELDAAELIKKLQKRVKELEEEKK